MSYRKSHFHIKQLLDPTLLNPAIDRPLSPSYGRVLCILLVTFPWTRPPSFIEFHSKDRKWHEIKYKLLFYWKLIGSHSSKRTKAGKAVYSPVLVRNNKIHIALHPGSKLNPLIHSLISYPQVGIPIKGYFIAFACLSKHDFWTFTRHKYIWASAWHVPKIASI